VQAGPDTAKPESDAEPASPEAGTRPQKGGEGGTTRFGMEDGDNTDTPATGVDPDRQSPSPPR
jgi:hypothetical protein